MRALVCQHRGMRGGQGDLPPEAYTSSQSAEGKLSNTLRTDSSPTDPRDISGHRKTLGPGTIHWCHGNRLHSCSSAASRVQRRGMVSPQPSEASLGVVFAFPPYQHSSKDPCGKQFSTTLKIIFFHKEGRSSCYGPNMHLF